MAHIIEVAKTGRASCRTCKKSIAKGELRLGEEVPNAFAAGETTHQWHHLPCAAKKKAAVLTLALESTDVEVPDKEALLNEAAAHKKGDKPAAFPYAERAKTGRSMCLLCSEAIEKGTLRVAVEREVDTGMFVTKGPGYLHSTCALGWLADNGGPDRAGLLAAVKSNSTALEAGDVAALELELDEA
jgi:hypothetical protein